MKRVLDVGNCPPDHAAIRDLVTGHFDAEVVQTHGVDDTLRQLQNDEFSLVLVNRKLDRDYSDGLNVIRRIKSDQRLAAVPVMLVTNLENHQHEAISAGAVEGFGKLALEDAETVEKLTPFLR